MTFRKLSSIAFASWSYEDCVYVLQDRRKLIREVAKYVIKKKYEKINPTTVHPRIL